MLIEAIFAIGTILVTEFIKVAARDIFENWSNQGQQRKAEEFFKSNLVTKQWSA